MQVSREPVRLGPLLKDADLVVSNAGAGLCAQSLLAGVPLLLLPHFMEQYLNARAVARSGAAAWIHGRKVQQQFGEVLLQVLDDPSYARCAQAIACARRAYAPGRTARTVADIIERLGRGGRKAVPGG